MLLWSVGLSQAAHYDAPVVSPEVIAQRVELSDAERAWIAQKKPVRIRVAENSPEQFMESGKAHGLAVDYVKLICEAHHLQCEFVPLLGGTFAESLQKMGQLDGPDVLLTARRTSERERFAGFTRPYLFTPWVIVARQDADPIFSLADLSGKKVVLEKGYVIRQRLSTDVPNLQIIDAKNTPEALNLLASGVADAYVGNWALSPVDLIRNATLAMREATKSAANPVVFFEPTIAQAARFKERISAEIPNAIDRREFRVVYQPIVTLASRRIDKVEALLRWQLGNNGDIGPDVFIPAAENQGLIGRLTDQVFETVCHDRNQWKSLGMMVPDVSVNISATTLQTPESLLSMLKRFDEPGRLKGITVEVTESALIEDPTGAKTSFAALRDLGFGVSLDDFGVGYSSLAYLTSFSLDFLKMDKAFLEGFEKDGARQSVVRAIIGVAHSLGMEVVAEGIETQEQLDLLKDLGCDYGQGYFFSRPLPAEQLVDYLKANRASS